MMLGLSCSPLASVFTIDVWSASGLVVTGGEDDKAYLWSLDGTLVHELGGHKDSVTAVRFNSNGKLVAAGAMDGNIRFLYP